MSVTIHPPGETPQQPGSSAQAPEPASRPAPTSKPGLDYVTDNRGRRLGVRTIGPRERMRIFKACGPVNAKIDQYVGLATLAYAVAEIDGEPVSPPLSELQVEALVERLGDDGTEAVARVMMERQGITEADIEAAEGNISEAVRIAGERKQREVLAAGKNSQKTQS